MKKVIYFTLWNFRSKFINSYTYSFNRHVLSAYYIPGTRLVQFKKISDTNGTFHAKMSTIKDRNGMDLTEAEDIKKRWQEYTEGLYKKDHDPDNHDGVITHLEPGILEYEVKWALGSITKTKLVEVMEFQLSYFRS